MTPRHFGVRSSNLVMMSLLLFVTSVTAQDVPEPKPVPRLQVIPLPYDQASFQRDGVEITRYHFGAGLQRPFLYPIVGPSGLSLTRMGHPHDPESHSHHNSVWISHFNVNGVDFWGDRSGAAIRHKRIAEYIDEGETSAIVAENEWVTPDGDILLTEVRRVTVTLLQDKEWLLVLDLTLNAKDKAVTLGKTPFGMIGVRMAKTLGVHDGGGRIGNSEGDVNEKEVFWKRARWVDYSGAIKDGVLEGVTLFDHPANPNHPSHFHVRNDGWMGASLTFDGPHAIEPNALLHLRYGLYIHADMKPVSQIERQWRHFAAEPETK
jgi:hypothetical protein